MKKFFALLVSFVSMIAVLSSCGGGDDEKAIIDPQKPGCNTLYLIGESSEYAFVDAAYTLTVGDFTTTLKLADLKQIRDYPGHVNNAVQLGINKGLSPEVYVYDIASNLHGEVTVAPAFTLHQDKLNDKNNIGLGVYCNLNVNGVGDVFYMVGLDKTRVSDYITARNGKVVLRSSR